MKRSVRILWSGAVTAVLALMIAPVITGQMPVGLVSLEPETYLNVGGLDVLHVQGQVYMISGAGGNVTIQVGDEGVLLVDTGAPG